MVKTNIFTKMCMIVCMICLFGVATPWQQQVAAASQIRITEIMYDPSGNGDREFIEFYNGSNTSASLAGWSTYGVDFVFPGGTSIGPGAYLVIVRNIAVFSANNPGVSVAGQYSGKLQGSGELVRLMDAAGNTISQVSYSFGGAWPSEPRNGGPSLSLLYPTANEAVAGCWGASISSGGSPGRANSASGGSGGCSPVAYQYTAPSSAPVSARSSSNQAVSTPANSAAATKTKTTQVQKDKTKSNQAQSQPQVTNNTAADTTQPITQVTMQRAITTTKNRWNAVGLIVLVLVALGGSVWIITRHIQKRRVALVLHKHEQNLKKVAHAKGH